MTLCGGVPNFTVVTRQLGLSTRGFPESPRNDLISVYSLSNVFCERSAIPFLCQEPPLITTANYSSSCEYIRYDMPKEGRGVGDQ